MLLQAPAHADSVGEEEPRERLHGSSTRPATALKRLTKPLFRKYSALKRLRRSVGAKDTALERPANWQKEYFDSLPFTCKMTIGSLNESGNWHSTPYCSRLVQPNTLMGTPLCACLTSCLVVGSMNGFDPSLVELIEGIVARTVASMVPLAPPRFLRTKEAAKRIGFSPKTLQNWRSSGKGPPWLRIGGKVVYEVAPFDAWCTRNLLPRSSAHSTEPLKAPEAAQAPAGDRAESVERLKPNSAATPARDHGVTAGRSVCDLCAGRVI
jgi:predicted DNA-binding transcriptional regulator AlpA